MPPDNNITSENLGDKLFEAAKISFGSKFGAVKHFVRAESEKLAITLRMIIESSATGAISKPEAKILLNQQKLAASAVFTAAEGITTSAAQAAINSSLKVVKSFINDKVGFTLL